MYIYIYILCMNLLQTYVENKNGNFSHSMPLAVAGGEHLQ